MKIEKKFDWGWAWTWPHVDIYHHWSIVSIALLAYAWFAPEKFGHWIGMIFEGINH